MNMMSYKSSPSMQLVAEIIRLAKRLAFLLQFYPRLVYTSLFPWVEGLSLDSNIVNSNITRYCGLGVDYP